MSQLWKPEGWLHTLGTGNNSPTLRRNIHARHSLIVSDELLLEFETIVPMRVQLDLGIAGHGKEGPVRAEGVVCNGLVEEEVYFRGYHDEYFLWLCGRCDASIMKTIGAALDYRRDVEFIVEGEVGEFGWGLDLEGLAKLVLSQF